MSKSISKPAKRSYLRNIIGREFYSLKRQLKWLQMSRQFAKPDTNVKLGHSIMRHRSMMLRPLRDVEMYLQHNKITNLRLAIAPIDGMVIRPGETFSIWQRVGRPTAGRGFLEGLFSTTDA